MELDLDELREGEEVVGVLRQEQAAWGSWVMFAVSVCLDFWVFSKERVLHEIILAIILEFC